MTTGYRPARTAAGVDAAGVGHDGRLDECGMTTRPGGRDVPAIAPAPADGMDSTDAIPGGAIPVAIPPGVAHWGYVYHCYDMSGRLVYIGSTANLAARLHVHSRQNPAADRFAVVRYWVMALGEARRLEVEQIQTERPPLNREHNPDYTNLLPRERGARFAELLATIPVSSDGPHLVDGRTQAEIDAGRRRVSVAMSELLRQIMPAA